MRKDLEQKDKILSTMLRKSKLDTAEKQLLLKEVKVSKAKKKQAELEAERWRAVSESRHERHLLKGIFANQACAKLDISSGVKEVSKSSKTRSQLTDIIFEYGYSELKTDPEVFSPLPDCHSPEGSEDLVEVVTADVKRLEGWVQAEAEKYATVIEKRHHLELDAFAEQMRLKDEKLRGFSLAVAEHGTRIQAAAVPSLTNDSFWPKVKIIKKKSEEQETETTLLDKSQKRHAEKEEVIPSYNKSKNIRLIVQSPEKEFEEEREYPNPGPIQKETNGSVVVDSVAKSALPVQSLSKTKNTPWRMDLRALGVSYKIKRLKQQLLMLERLTGKQESGEDMEGGDNGMKGFLLLISLLNKQVNRYQSLQGKTDDLCKRIHDNDLDMSQRDCSTTKSRGETRTLEHFLEETFQLLRYMVATGQKLMEIQYKMASGFIGVELDKTATFNMNEALLR
ncbi:hypothetical protein CRYUN_Cryun13aG0088900 [Craigia yunnanensis]